MGAAASAAAPIAGPGCLPGRGRRSYFFFDFFDFLSFFFDVFFAMSAPPRLVNG